MTVWTQVVLSDANAWLQKHYGIQARTILSIAEGVEDSVFRLEVANNHSLFLRLFERTEPSGPLSIASNLARAGLPTCPPIKNNEGTLHAPLNGKPASLFPWVEGSWVSSPDSRQIASIGSFLGQIANAKEEFCGEWQRDNPRGLRWFADELRPEK